MIRLRLRAATRQRHDVAFHHDCFFRAAGASAGHHSSRPPKMKSTYLIPILCTALAHVGSAADTKATLPAAPSPEWVNRLFAGWHAPVPPRHLVGNIYYVGAIGVSSFLITTPEGHILLDTGFEDTVPIIRRGVEQLGFRFTDIKLILSSHAHID